MKGMRTLSKMLPRSVLLQERNKRRRSPGYFDTAMKKSFFPLCHFAAAAVNKYRGYSLNRRFNQLNFLLNRNKTKCNFRIYEINPNLYNLDYRRLLQSWIMSVESIQNGIKGHIYLLVTRIISNFSQFLP